MSKYLTILSCLLTICFASASYANSNVVVINNTGLPIKVGGHVISHKDMHVSSYTAKIELLDGRSVHLHDTGHKCHKQNKWKYTVDGADIFEDPAQCTHLGWGAIGCQAAIVQLVDGYKVRVDMSDSSKCTGEWIRENADKIIAITEIIAEVMETALEPELVEMTAYEISVELAKAFAKEAVQQAIDLAPGEFDEFKKAAAFSRKSQTYYAGVQARKAIQANDKTVANKILRVIKYKHVCQMAGAKWNSSKDYEKHGNACSI